MNPTRRRQTSWRIWRRSGVRRSPLTGHPGCSACSPIPTTRCSASAAPSPAAPTPARSPAIVSLTQGEAGQIRDAAAADAAHARARSGSRSCERVGRRPRGRPRRRASTSATATSTQRPLGRGRRRGARRDRASSSPTSSSRSVPTAGSGTPTTSPRAWRRSRPSRAMDDAAPAAARQVPDARAADGRHASSSG